VSYKLVISVIHPAGLKQAHIFHATSLLSVQVPHVKESSFFSKYRNELHKIVVFRPGLMNSQSVRVAIYVCQQDGGYFK
jgi:hypothetical protein